MGELRDRFIKWVTASDERFYRTFLVSLVVLFTVLSFFFLFAVVALIVSGSWWYYYETIIKRTNKIHGKLY